MEAKENYGKIGSWTEGIEWEKKARSCITETGLDTIRHDTIRYDTRVRREKRRWWTSMKHNRHEGNQQKKYTDANCNTIRFSKVLFRSHTAYRYYNYVDFFCVLIVLSVGSGWVELSWLVGWLIGWLIGWFWFCWFHALGAECEIEKSRMEGGHEGKRGGE